MPPGAPPPGVNEPAPGLNVNERLRLRRGAHGARCGAARAVSTGGGRSGRPGLRVGVHRDAAKEGARDRKLGCTGLVDARRGLQSPAGHVAVEEKIVILAECWCVEFGASPDQPETPPLSSSSLPAEGTRVLAARRKGAPIARCLRPAGRPGRVGTVQAMFRAAARHGGPPRAHATILRAFCEIACPWRAAGRILRGGWRT